MAEVATAGVWVGARVEVVMVGVAKVVEAKVGVEKGAGTAAVMAEAKVAAATAVEVMEVVMVEVAM